MIPTCSVDYPQGARTQKIALVVDDVEDMLDLLEIALHGSDFAVLRASSSTQAMALFQARGSDIDLLMTDVRIGSESGLDLARRVLALKPNLPVLAISGFALNGRVVSGKGRIEFLPKPFSTSELRLKLQSIFAPQTARASVSLSSPNGRYRVAAARQPKTTIASNLRPSRRGQR